jgi:tetratricopeptide (TPR) repeat protein
VEKDRFNYLLNHYNSLSPEETAELRQEENHYGYCQVLHQLIARGDQDNQAETKDQSLQVAAVYSTDRAVLKRILSEPRAQRLEQQPSIIGNVEKAPATPASPTSEVSKPVVTPEVPTVVVQKEEPKIMYATPPSAGDFDVEAAVSRFVAELAPMREKKLQFEKAMEEFEKKMNQDQEEKPKRKTKAKEATSTNEQLLEEIKTSKKKVVPETSKQKEQIQIIDQFIKSKPSISKPSPHPPDVDLTELPDTYNENVVSETLALILIRQGKKEKAVEVLRKLIWKFPQKKAYFAAQIEELSK